MASMFKSIILTVLACFIVSAAPVDASGLRLVKNGDTYYLSTTEEDADSKTTTTYKVVSVNSTTSAKRSNSSDNYSSTDIVAPRGYTENIGDLITFLMRIIIILALLLVFFNFIMAGIEWITSGGDKGKTDSARQRIIAAVVGILVLSAAFALAQLVAYILGFDSFNDIFSTIKRIND